MATLTYNRRAKHVTTGGVWLDSTKSGTPHIPISHNMIRELAKYFKVWQFTLKYNKGNLSLIHC